MLGFGMIGFGGFGLRFLQGGICDSGFEVPFESFIMLDGGLGFRFFLGGSGGDNFGALELGAWMILNLGGTIGFTSLGSGFRVPSDSCTMLLFTLNSAWPAFDAYYHHSICITLFTSRNLHHFS